MAPDDSTKPPQPTTEHPYVRAVAGHTAVHYGTENSAECGAEQPFRYSHRPEDITCRTCRGWLPIVAPELQQRPTRSLVGIDADAVKFLELLLSECHGADDHSWRKCRRCLAFSELEGHQPLARGFVKAAIAALRNGVERK